MNEFYGDVVRRSLAAAGEGTDEEGTARRKARFKASITELEKDPRVRDRIDGIAVAVGIVDQVEASRIDSPVIDAEHAGREAPGRRRHWRLQGTWLAFGGIAAVAAWTVTALSSKLALIFVVGMLLGLVAGGALYIRYLRSAIADDIGPQLRRLQADVDPQLRRVQCQLDNIESAVNLALASRYAELSQHPLPSAIFPPESPTERGRPD